MNTMEDAFNMYFSRGADDNTKNKKFNMAPPSTIVKQNPRENLGDNSFNQVTLQRLMADGNIDTIDQICDIIKPLLNAAWGNGWGEFSPDLKHGEKSDTLVLPQIVAEMNERDIADGMPMKPVLMDTFKEESEGKYTGDTILVYRQWFDCNVEFDFYGRNGKETRELLHRFENLLQVYAGYLKRHGISEITFLREFGARNSLNFTEQVPMKCLIFYIRFERITALRASMINKINTEIGIKPMDEADADNVAKHNKAAAHKSSNDIEDLDFDLNFGEGIDDTGI